MNDLMSIETHGYTSNGGMWTTTPILRGTRIRAVDQKIAAMDAAEVASGDVDRRLNKADEIVERFDENARLEAIAAGARGERFDAADSRARKAAAILVRDDLRLEAVAAKSALDSARSSYFATLSANIEKLRQSGRDEAVLAMQEMTLARESLGRAAARLGAALPILSGASELVNGMQPNLTAPRTAADSIDDGGHPGVHAQEAEAQVEVALTWLARWIERADEQAEARKAEARKAEAKKAKSTDGAA